MKTITNTWLVLSACLLAVPTAYADDTDEARRIATQMIKADAIRFLTDRKFDVEGEVVEGKAQAVDPEEHVKVEVKNVLLVPEHVSLTAELDARFEFHGKLKADDKEVKVEATAKLRPELHIEADYHFEDGQLKAEGRVTDAKFEAEVLELSPGDIPGGKRAAKELIEKELEQTKADHIRMINDWIRKNYSI